MTPQARDRPVLVLVQGAPASGKTSLARRLATDLGLPLLSCDRPREIVADAEPASATSFDDSRKLGSIAFRLHLALIQEFLAAGMGLIAEANFHRGIAEDVLRPLLSICRAILIHCRVDPAISQRRFVERFERGERHWSFFDAERLARIRSGQRPVDWSRYEPLDLGLPTCRVDTTDGYDPPYDHHVSFIRHVAQVEAQSPGRGGVRV